MKYYYGLDVNNLYGYPKSQKLLVDGFKLVKNTSKFNEDFTKDCHRESNKEYVLKVDVESVYRLHEIHNDLPFLTERMKIGKLKNLYDKEKHLKHVRKLKQALNHGLVLKRAHRAIKFNREVWLKPCIDMNNKLRKMQKMVLKKIFSHWWIILSNLFVKLMKNFTGKM